MTSASKEIVQEIVTTCICRRYSLHLCGTITVVLNEGEASPVAKCARSNMTNITLLDGLNKVTCSDQNPW